LDRVEKGLESLTASFQALVKNLPGMMREAVRDVLCEREGRT
jgi:hypothetical protein